MRRLALLAVVVGLAGCGSASVDPALEQRGRFGPVELVRELQGGGLVVFLRHAASDRSRDDDPIVDLDDCSTQRNLIDKGRAQARTIGEAFRALGIPVWDARRPAATPFSSRTSSTSVRPPESRSARESSPSSSRTAGAPSPTSAGSRRARGPDSWKSSRPHDRAADRAVALEALCFGNTRLGGTLRARIAQPVERVGERGHPTGGNGRDGLLQDVAQLSAAATLGKNEPPDVGIAWTRESRLYGGLGNPPPRLRDRLIVTVVCDRKLVDQLQAGTGHRKAHDSIVTHDR